MWKVLVNIHSLSSDDSVQSEYFCLSSGKKTLVQLLELICHVMIIRLSMTHPIQDVVNILLSILRMSLGDGDGADLLESRLVIIYRWLHRVIPTPVKTPFNISCPFLRGLGSI
jgi:hypothetical protein